LAGSKVHACKDSASTINCLLTPDSDAKSNARQGIAFAGHKIHGGGVVVALMSSVVAQHDEGTHSAATGNERYAVNLRVNSPGRFSHQYERRVDNFGIQVLTRIQPSRKKNRDGVRVCQRQRSCLGETALYQIGIRRRGRSDHLRSNGNRGEKESSYHHGSIPCFCIIR
jgi:hypothetical protein